MHEKPVKLDMDFSEALARLAQTPKSAIDAIEPKVRKKKTEARKTQPRSGSRKTA